MKQLKKMSARGTTSCDVAKKLVRRRLGNCGRGDLELYNKEGTTDVSLPPKHSVESTEKLARTGSEWQKGYIGISQKEAIFSSSHDNEVNCYEHSEARLPSRRKTRQAQGSWKELKYLRTGLGREGRGGMTWDEIVDRTDSSREQVNLVYRQKKALVQRSSRLVDIYKEKSRAMGSKKKEGQGRAKDILAQFDEIQAKYDIDLDKRAAKRKETSPKGEKSARKAMRLKPGKQLKLEGLIGEEGGRQKGDLSQYQSLNYSVDPLAKKAEKKSISQKKQKGTSQQIKKRPAFGTKPLHVRNKSSATLAENKFAGRRPKKVKKISLNEQKSMHSELLANLREQSYRYIPRKRARNYVQQKNRKGEKDVRIKEYEPHTKSVERPSHSKGGQHLELQREAFLEGELSKEFASHHELFEETQAGERQPSPKKGREQKEDAKKSLQHKKKSAYKKSVLNYTKPKNRKAKRRKDKGYLKDFSTLRVGESFKFKERNVTLKMEKDFTRAVGRKKYVLKVERKFGGNQHSPAIGSAAKQEEKPINSMTLNAPEEKRKNRHYIVNDILEKKGFDLNVLSSKNGKKGAKEFLFRPKPEKRRKSKSVKISLNNIRSSVAHLEKALAKEKNRLKNICNVAKNKQKPKKIKKKTTKTKENCEVRSPKALEAQTFEEGRPKKKKKKAGKLSTKNLLNKFNKMSYFDYKRTQHTKKNRRPRKLQVNEEEEEEWGTSVSKPKKNILYER